MITNDSISTPKLQTNAVTTIKLDAIEIKVGGGGSKPGKFGVYDTGGSQIGFIGEEGGLSGGWFKELRVGGASAAAATFVANSSGAVTMTSVTITSGASIDGGSLDAGTVDTDTLNAIEIKVGGGGSKPAKFGVYDTGGSQIGFIGEEGGLSGGWFKELRAGGASAAAAVFVSDSGGNVSITGGTWSLSSGGDDYKINGTDGIYQENSLGDFVKLKSGIVLVSSTGGGTRKVEIEDAVVRGTEPAGNLTFILGTFSDERGQLQLYRENTETVHLTADAASVSAAWQADSGLLHLQNSASSTRVLIGTDTGDNGQIILHNDAGTEHVTIGGDGNLGQADSGYMDIQSSTGLSRIEMGTDSSVNGKIIISIVSSNDTILFESTNGLGQADSGFIQVSNSSGSRRVQLGVNSSGTGEIHIDGNLILGARHSNISDPSGGGNHSFSPQAERLRHRWIWKMGSRWPRLNRRSGEAWL